LDVVADPETEALVLSRRLGEDDGDDEEGMDAEGGAVLALGGDRPHARVRCGSSGAQEAEAEEEAAARCAGPGALRLLWVCVLLHAKLYFGRPLLLVFELGVSAAIAAFLGILYFADFYEGPIPVDQQQLCPGHLQALCPNAKTSCRP
jgi:hypothetical protein